MENDAWNGAALAGGIVDQVETLLLEAEREGKPLEIDPWRARLFELFVTAEAAGYTEEEAEFDLTAEGLCQALAGRWGLAEAMRSSLERNSKLPPAHLARMRLLWSVLRMWMEWTYAWRRWPEFHSDRPPRGLGGAGE